MLRIGKRCGLCLTPLFIKAGFIVCARCDLSAG